MNIKDKIICTVVTILAAIILIAVFNTTRERRKYVLNWEPETICLEGITYFKGTENMNSTEHMRVNYPKYNILVRNGKVVRCGD